MLLASIAPVALMGALAMVSVLLSGDVARVAFAQTGALAPFVAQSIDKICS